MFKSGWSKNEAIFEYKTQFRRSSKLTVDHEREHVELEITVVVKVTSTSQTPQCYPQHQLEQGATVRARVTACEGTGAWVLQSRFPACDAGQELNPLDPACPQLHLNMGKSTKRVT